MKKQYRHVFFDLDRTLWDFETNATLTLHEVYTKFKLQEIGVANAEDFITCYKEVNEKLWTEYRKGKITKAQLRTDRYHYTLMNFQVNDQQLAANIGAYYIAECPQKKNLVAGALETLQYLNEKYYLHIITNGFEEVQHIKLSHSGLSDFFKKIITSEGAGAKKPSPKIFRHALSQTNAKRKESIYIGDDFAVDILGARKAGIDQIFFNPKKVPFQPAQEPNYAIESLQELRAIL